jgi:hypothetical protein
MSLLNYAYHANPSDHHDVLNKLKSFAVSIGWTSDYYYDTNIDWGSTGGTPPYGFISGGRSMCQLYSTGYGVANADLIVRYACNIDSGDPQHEWFIQYGVKPGERTLDYYDSNGPLTESQGIFSDYIYGYNSMSPGTMNAVWFFGTTKILIMVISVDTSFCYYTVFGFPELFDETDPGVIYSCGSCFQNSVSKVYWYNANNQRSEYRLPWQFIGSGGPTCNAWGVRNSSEGPTRRYGTSCNTDVSAGYFAECRRAVRLNSWTGKRTMIKPIEFYYNPTAGVWYPLGTWPFYYIPFAGFSMGDTVTYGAEEYLVFPDCFASRQNGIAFRIV